MKTTTRIVSIFVLLMCGQWPVTALGAHPLLTEDTGTQGAGHVQLELTHDLSHTKGGSTNTRDQRINTVLSIGLTDTLDALVSLPHERQTDQLAATDASSIQGFADLERAAGGRGGGGGARGGARRPGRGGPAGGDD